MTLEIARAASTEVTRDPAAIRRCSRYYVLASAPHDVPCRVATRSHPSSRRPWSASTSRRPRWCARLNVMVLSVLIAPEVLPPLEQRAAELPGTRRTEQFLPSTRDKRPRGLALFCCRHPGDRDACGGSPFARRSEAALEGQCHPVVGVHVADQGLRSRFRDLLPRRPDGRRHDVCRELVPLPDGERVVDRTARRRSPCSPAAPPSGLRARLGVEHQEGCAAPPSALKFHCTAYSQRCWVSAGDASTGPQLAWS